MSNYSKPVVFKLNEFEYGLDIGLVNAIERYQPIVPVPNTLNFIKGIINLREEVIPVYDLRKKFGLGEYEGNGIERKLIVVRVGDEVIAIEVDAVSEIYEFPANKIVDMPKIVTSDETKFMRRVANKDGRLIVLMDIENLLSEEELAGVKKMKEDLK